MNSFQRYLFPSIADLLFVGLLLTRVQPTLFHDGDTGWHLWAGMETLRHGPGPLPDALSFTRSGVLWDNVEWGGELLLALMQGYAGYLGVALLCGVVFAGTFSWLYRILLRETGDPPVALLVTALAAQINLIQFLARPLVFSFPLFLAVVVLLRKPDPGRRTLVMLPALTVIWANIHPSAYLAPAMMVFFWLARSRPRALGIAAGASILALGLTPWGYHWVYGMVLENRAYFGQVEEWASPEFGQLRFLPYLLYLVLALVARRGGVRLTVGEAVWGLGWMLAALVSARLGPYAALAWAPLLARDLAGSPGLNPRWIVGRIWLGARTTLGPMEAALRPRIWPVAAAAFFLVLSPWMGGAFPSAAAGFPGDRFPRAALAEADDLDLGPRVMTRYAWGGFVAWESERRYRTFIDGRAGFFGAELLDDYMEFMTLGPGWHDVLQEHRPDWVLLAPESPLVSVLGGRDGWTIFYRDETAVILAPASDSPEITSLPTRTR